ncbi:hypothetical protein MYU51_015677 [Penicillium brevicompactum]
MKLYGAIIFTAFFVLVFAVPITRTLKTGLTSIPLGERSQVNDCLDSTFDDQSSNASPLVADCLKIASNISGGGSWTILSGSQHQLVQYGTCAFGVTYNRPINPAIMHLGNQDIIDLIKDSIKKFEWYGKVGSKGMMKCKVNNGDHQIVRWGLYHN